MDGVPMVVRIARVLEAAGLEPVIVSKAARGLGIPEILEEADGWHPLIGVAAGLRELERRGETEGFFTPCDLVDLEVEVVRRLVEERGVARGQPLCGVLPVGLRERAEELARRGGRVRELVEGVRAVEVGEVRNLNRPGEAGR